MCYTKACRSEIGGLVVSFTRRFRPSGKRPGPKSANARLSRSCALARAARAPRGSATECVPRACFPLIAGLAPYANKAHVGARFSFRPLAANTISLLHFCRSREWTSCRDSAAATPAAVDPHRVHSRRQILRRREAAATPAAVPLMLLCRLLLAATTHTHTHGFKWRPPLLTLALLLSLSLCRV